jgi:ubiquinone/menaquinone biosynthesis C-methylase UbiE
MDSLSFDHLVTHYDETRDFDLQSFLKALNTIKSLLPPNKYSKIFEPGIGNGRIAIPLVKLGYKVSGIDISENMLKELSIRIAKEKIDGLDYKIGDVSCLPFENLCFDATIATHLFYFVSDWKKACDEIARVTKGPVILLHTGMGQEISVLNDKYKFLCQKYGAIIPQIGASSTKEVVEYFKQKGYQVTFEDKWTWKKKVEHDRAITYLEKRAYSFTGWANESIHAMAIKDLREENLVISEVEDRISLIVLDLNAGHST